MSGGGQHRDTDPSSGRSVGATLALLIIAVASLAAGGGLHYVRHLSLRNLQDARTWIETPCTIERCEFVTDSDDDSSLQFAYRYEIDGREYHGDNLDPIIGRMGDDDEFEEAIHRRHSVGTQAVCFVDPADPTRSVFDREHGADAPRRMWLLAFPFTCVGLGFCFALIGSLVGEKRGAATDVESATAQLAGRPLPRRLPLLTQLSVLTGPTSAQLVWLFVVGFAYVFIILDGPASYARLFQWNSSQRTTDGRVLDSREIDQRELGVDIYKVKVAYVVDDTSYENDSYVRGDEFSEGDAVTVSFDPSDPGHGVIPGARRSGFTWWHSAIPLGVLLLLGLGLLLMYRRNYGVLKLLKRGRAAPARWNTQSKAPDDEIQAATLVTNYQFDVAGNTYSALQYTAPAKGKRRRVRTQTAATDCVTVLYDPRSPKRNVIVDAALIEMIDDSRSRGDRIIDCATAPVAIGILILLFQGAGLI
ncbi:MAG: DUF3592 domain-containing protein [Phycisphaerales bacterium]|nr:DUF3592 domain-containing protein [Phycisphaerales bacterium]MCB9857226.1 DUF3592 domain-containing protein [Phycisphaerales bacterium]MCB9863060.1 DUF3592 domain-containing protein [Phycisphaerales bacterium]